MAYLDYNGLQRFKTNLDAQTNGLIASVYDSTKTYDVGDYVIYNNDLYRCITAITTAEAWTAAHWTQVALSDDIEKLREDVNENLMDKLITVYPKNLFDGSAVENGKYLNPNGTWETLSNRLVTDYIPVTVGKKIVTSYATSDTEGSAVTKSGYSAITCFDSSKTVKTGGNYNSNGFTVPSGVSYVRITLAKNASWYWQVEERDDTTPTTYSPYFAPYLSYNEDFLTVQSKEAVDKLVNKQTTLGDLSNNYACALLKGYTFRQTVGLSESWYYESCVSPKTPVYIYCGVEYYEAHNDHIAFPNSTALSSANGSGYKMYDELLNVVDSDTGSAGYGRPRKIVAESLANCSCLVIGDSTVDQDTMTQNMLDYFTSKSKTLTLLGTLGSGSNKNEGRAGWKATDYLTNKTYDGVTNPFYNPNTQTFDFSYYMTNQGYSAPDFVVLQLGINDLYNYGVSAIEPTWLAIKAMIDSILSYNNSIKILLNLPTVPNSDQSEHSVFLPLYQNRIVKYNQYAIAQALKLYGESKVRPTYCHLVLDPTTDISDNVHPNSGGYLKMAKEVISQINVWQNGY